MPNSDNTYGTYNKQTKIFTQVAETPTVFANTEEAKSHFFTPDALAVNDECCTNLQWALVSGDNTKLKVTFDFGTKGTPGIAEADDWAGQYNSRKTALIDSKDWANNAYTTEEVDSHLF